MLPQPGSTTCPASTDRSTGGIPRALRIRWVFPEPRVLNVETRHIVGRDPNCDCSLPGLEVSRRHVEIRVDGPLVAFSDLKSRNGVYINGRRRELGPLSVGDVIRCGEWVGVMTLESDHEGFREVAPGWFGGSALAASMSEVRHLPHDLPIVIEGETGSGKECAARAIHASSARMGEFIAVNCAALPDHLVESQLFGHRRGAFTGAEKSSLGYFRAAHGGSLFLDEIQELPISIQPKLLRAIERREVVAVGDTHPTPVDVRIIAASQEPLAPLVTEGRFRPDLLARLDGLTVVLPPLRLRREDVAPLFLEFLRQQLLQKVPAVDSRLVESLCVYDWPLNVRELLLLTRRIAAVHGLQPCLRREHLPQRLLDHMGTSPATNPPPPNHKKRSWRPVDDKDEFAALTEALRTNRGNVSRAAAAIGISRARAYRLLSAHQENETNPSE